MSPKNTDQAARPDVTIYPTADAWIPDVPAVEQTVAAERADELLAYQPPAFTLEPPPVPVAAEPTPSTDTPASEADGQPQEV